LGDKTEHETTVVPIDLSTGGAKTGRWYRVVVGRFATAEEAQRAAKSFMDKGWIDYAKVYRIVD
jgi:hypothetical protein